MQNALPQYDGVLVLHGTDTLAYTAALFALALPNDKPIIFTGSQKPFSADNSDAPRNLYTAINALQRNDIKEVLLAFHGKLFPAIGCSKVSTETDDAFANSHFGTWQPEIPTPAFSGCFSGLQRTFNPKTRVMPLYLTPSHSTEAAAHLLHTFTADAAILMSFGHGNAPADAHLLAAIEAFVSQGKIVLNISQVPQGCAAAVYAQGNALRQSGVINGGKCNIETATPLLMLAAANNWSADDVTQELLRLKLI